MSIFQAELEQMFRKYKQQVQASFSNQNSVLRHVPGRLRNQLDQTKQFRPKTSSLGSKCSTSKTWDSARCRTRSKAKKHENLNNWWKWARSPDSKQIIGTIDEKELSSPQWRLRLSNGFERGVW